MHRTKYTCTCAQMRKLQLYKISPLEELGEGYTSFIYYFNDNAAK